MENSRSVSSPRADRRERENARRREDVLGAASTAFAERGFQGAQVSEIAAAAELSTKSVYALFPSKEVLYEEVIRSRGVRGPAARVARAGRDASRRSGACARMAARASNY